MRKRSATSRIIVNFGLIVTLAIVLVVYRPLFFKPSNTPSSVTGTASVVDGNTIDIGGRRIRLYGIDAPERAQTCNDGRGVAYACGRMAADALEVRIGRRTVVCDPRDVDAAHRIVAVCRTGQIDVNEWMVRQGWATADRQFSRSYASDEDAARSERLGIWAGQFVPPADWRRDHP